MSYYTKITKAGLAAITAAMNNNSKVPITYMAFGDGNGYIPEPDENATSLVNEVYRVGVNKVEVHNKNPNWLVCEAIIPSAVGGFNIREVALYDSTGNTMLAIASYPPTYKPTVEEGAAKIQTIRIVIQVDNSGSFELIVDPDVVLATAQYVDSKIKATLGSKNELYLYNPTPGKRVFLSSINPGQNEGGGEFLCIQSDVLTNNDVTVFTSKLIGFENYHWVRINFDCYTPEMGGAVGDYNGTTGTDDYDAIQKVLKVAYPPSNSRFGEIGKEVSFDSSKRYFVSKEILVPPFAKINGNRTIMYGLNKTNDCFVSAIWDSGELIKTTSESGSQYFLSWVELKNFRFRHFNRSIFFVGLTQQTLLERVESTQCNQHIVSKENYFLTVNISTADQVGVGTGLPAYQFSTLNGMLNLNNLQAGTCDIAYQFEGGAQANRLSTLDAESCGTAIKFKNMAAETGGILITGGYFENCDLVLDVKDVGVAGSSTFTLENNFINCQNGDLADTGDGVAKVIFDEEKNYLRAINNLVKGSNSLSLSDTKLKALQHTGGATPPNSPNGSNSDKNVYVNNNPERHTFGIHTQLITQFREMSGYVQAKHIDYRKGLIPYTYYGNQGTPEANIIPFCSHERVVTDSVNNIFSLKITTAIKNNLFLSAFFNLKISDSRGGFMVSGRIYNDVVVVDRNTFSDATSPLSFRVITENNVVIVFIDGLKGTTHQAEGFIRLI